MYDIPFRSMPDMLRKNADSFAARPALKYKKQGRYVTLSYAEYYHRALMAARGLIKMGMRPGDRVAILSENRAGWVIADMGILAAGCITVPIYPTNTPESIEYVLNHSGARIVFVSNRYQYAKLLKIKESIPLVELVVSFERFLGEHALPVCTFYQLSEIDMPITEAERASLENGIDRIPLEAPLTIIYTSGTTGVPKGVVLNHRNILYDVTKVITGVKDLSSDDVMLSFLPLSHVLERTVGYYTTVSAGALLAFAESVEKVPENLVEVKPTIMISVPRLFEKIYSGILENVHQMSGVRKALFRWALTVGKEYVHRKYISKEPLGMVQLKYKLADRLVFGKVRQRFGGRIKFFCSGGAPLDKTINEFFWCMGLPILEGYGLTETSPAISFNRLDHVRFGSVGCALDGTEFRVAEDGELLVKGPQVMSGYYRNEEATAEVLQDGWFKTGDIGQIDAEGFVYITDRKKELIITAGGKNIAPQPIENSLKLDKYISQAYVYGDRKSHLSALITPNLERLFEFAREKQIKHFDLDDLVTNQRVHALYEQRIAEVNSRLAQFETIKRFVLLPRDFSIDGGELTPTLKLRRKVIYEKYKEKIEGMYSDGTN